MRRLAAGLMLALLAVVGAHGQTPSQRDALEATVLRFQSAMQQEDAGALTKLSLPPRFLTVMAESLGVTVQELVASGREQMEAVFDDNPFSDFGMDVGAANHGVAGETQYAFIPTVTVLRIGAVETTTIRSQSLAVLEDDNRWYLLRLADAPQIALFRRAYPQFADVQIPPEPQGPAAP